VKVQFKGKIAKESAYNSDNEDALSCSPTKGVAVISDGASESFDAKNWSTILVNRYQMNQDFNARWLKITINSYKRKFNSQELNWSRQAAYNRGSYASLLGVVEVNPTKSLDVFSIGDSLAVLLRNNQLVDTFPYKNSVEFNQHPELVSTIFSNNSYLFEDNFFEKHRVSWPIDVNTTVLLMTDALGAWSLRNNEKKNEVWTTLSNVKHKKDLLEIVEYERQEKTMRVDDSTLIVLTF